MKRLLDITVSVFALVLLLPLMLMLALAIRVCIGSPVLFRQVRPGLQGHPFTLLKFRTMKDSRDAHGRLLLDAERITPLGSAARYRS